MVDGVKILTDEVDVITGGFKFFKVFKFMETLFGILFNVIFTGFTKFGGKLFGEVLDLGGFEGFWLRSGSSGWF
jgi:hypothetical protein